MNKLTKLLSVFVIAGAIGTGVAGVAGLTGCKKDNHTHDYKYTKTDDNSAHNGECECGKDPILGEAHEWGDDDECDKCHYVRVGSIAVTQTELTMHVGDKATLNATITPATADHRVRWSTSDATKVKVNETTGEVEAVGIGENVTVTATAVDGGKTATCKITVAPILVESIEVIGGAKMDNTRPVTLRATVSPANATDKTITWSITSGDTLATIDPVTGVLTANAGATGEVTVTATATNNKSVTHKITIEAAEEGVTKIYSAEQLNEFRTTAATPAGTYKLGCDIDLDGFTLEATKAVLSNGVIFDGNGYTISNATYNAAEKTGILFESSSGGTVTNVKFLGCTANGTGNETAGIVVGLGNGGTFSKLEFNSCAVSCNNYGGLVIGRNNGKATISISEITAKNGCTVTTQQYGGLLIGDILGTSTVNFKDLQLDGELKGSSGNGSFVAGRTRAGCTVSVENAVISATIATPANNAIFSGNGACASLTVKNVLIIKSNSSLIAKVAPTAHVYENVATVEGVTVTDATATNGQNTVAYLTDTIGLDFTNTWMAEGDNGGYRLKAASTNIKSPDATIKKIKLNTSNAKLRFKVGEEFTVDGLIVMGAYSDGVQLVLEEGSGFIVNANGFKNEAGTYTIMIASEEDLNVMATYDVVVAAQTGFIVIDEHMSHTYLQNGELDSANIVVKSTWTDGIEEKLSASEFTIDEASYDMTTVGEYNVKIKHGTFEDIIVKISVQATKPIPVDGKIYVNVDASYTGANGAQVKGIETFNTVASAIDYLEACNLDASVQKVIYVGAGTYEGKITTSLANLVLIGEGNDKSVLTYSAVEGMVNPVNEKTWGMDCATLHVNGEGFKAYNLTIRNDFDYIRDNKKYASPQGFALTINGDKAVLENCHLYGNQDTLYFKGGRTYLKNTVIEGNVDFIFGENTGLAYFDHCTIKAISRYDASTANKSNNGYVTAMKGDAAKKPDYGYIFDTCDFTHGEGVEVGSMSLGRPWGAAATVAMINCTFSNAYSTHGFKTDLKDPAKPNEYIKGRWEEMSGNNPDGADFVEFGSKGDGAITATVAGGSIIDETAAANYTAANLFKGKNGKLAWESGDWAYADDVALLTTLAGDRVAATGLYVSTESISVEAGTSAALHIGIGPWNASDKSGASNITVTSSDETVVTWAGGVLTGLKEGTATLTVTDGTTTKTVAVTVTKATSKKYTYTYNGTNGAEWTTEGNPATTTSSDNVVALKLEPEKSLVLTASGTKATVTVTGFTTGSSNASKYLKVDFLDASGAVVGTLEGTTTQGKVNGEYTFENNVVETTAAFASVKLYCGTSGKSAGVVTVSIEVALAE